MKLLSVLITLFLLSVPAHADPAYISEEGQITLTGEVNNVSSVKNEFTILYNGEEIDVSMDQIDEETLNLLLETNIIKSGSFITVTGELKDNVTGSIINASSINVYSNNTSNSY